MNNFATYKIRKIMQIPELCIRKSLKATKKNLSSNIYSLFLKVDEFSQSAQDM